jgi:hypothetical protein
VSRLIDPDTFLCFIYGYDQLLENLDSDGDDNDVASPTVGSSIGPSSEGQMKPSP